MAFNRETVNDQQLHLAALQGSVEGIKRVMATGKITVSNWDPSVDHSCNENSLYNLILLIKMD